MFHHRFIKQKEALGFSLSFLIYRFVGGFPFASFFTALPFFRGCPFASSLVVLSFFRGCSFASSFVALSFFRGCSLASFLSLHRSSEVFFCLFFLSFHRSSEAFICSSFFVYFIYERLVVVGQQGEPIVAACLKSNMGGAQEGGFRHGHLFDLGNVYDQWARQAAFVYVEDAFVGYDVCGVDGAFNGDQGCHGKACADDGPCACVLPEASKGTDGMQRYGGDVLQGYTAMECSVHIVLKWQSSCQLVKLST